MLSKTLVIVRKARKNFVFDGGLNSVGAVYRLCQSGPAGYPRSGTRLIGTVPVVHRVPSALDFLPENRPGRNPSLGG